MLLQALTSYYDRLEQARAEGLPPYGFSTEKISFCIVLNRNGSVHVIEDVRIPQGKKLLPRPLIVPHRGTRSSGVQANFLWDNTGYAIGADGKGHPERTRRTFDAFVSLHRDLAPLVENDEGFALVLKFLNSWDPERAESLDNWDEIRSRNVVFRVRGEDSYVHESHPVQSAWRQFLKATSDAADGQCLVTGAQGHIARLHDLISGFPGAQTSGAGIVSFNQPAFESYGREQSFNAPVAVETVFKYTTALDRLVRDRRHRIALAGDTILFWTDRPTPIEEFFGPVVEGFRPEDEGLRDRVRVFFERLGQGKPPTDDLDGGPTRFFVVGIAPNAARLSIRFWHDTTVSDLCQRLAEHVSDLSIAGDDELPLTIRDLVAETSRDPKDAPPLLAGALLRSILAGAPYPEGLYAAVLRRIRADGKMTRARAAILKAHLVRKLRRTRSPMEVAVSLDPTNPDPAYQLGRLFAALEKIQKDALGHTVNATIKDRFFGAASATPAMVFPRLVRLSQHHLAKIDNPAWRTAHEKRLGEIFGRIPARSFPRHLNLDQQGLFAIAYYHQNRALYQPSSAVSATANQE